MSLTLVSGWIGGILRLCTPSTHQPHRYVDIVSSQALLFISCTVYYYLILNYANPSALSLAVWYVHLKVSCWDER